MNLTADESYIPQTMWRHGRLFRGSQNKEGQPAHSFRRPIMAAVGVTAVCQEPSCHRKSRNHGSRINLAAQSGANGRRLGTFLPKATPRLLRHRSREAGWVNPRRWRVFSAKPRPGFDGGRRFCDRRPRTGGTAIPMRVLRRPPRPERFENEDWLAG